MTAISDKIKNKVSSINEYMLNGFTGAVTGAISGSIDNAKKLGEGAKLVAEAVSGFIIGTGEDAARQAFVEGKKEVNVGQSVMKGIKNAALAVAVPLIIKGGQSVVNKIKTPGVNTVTKSLANNADNVTSKGVGNVLENANFAQKTYGSSFSMEGKKFYSKLAGKPINTIDELVGEIKSGTIKSSDIPIDYIIRDGNTLILNTRSSQALTQAGIARNQ